MNESTPPPRAARFNPLGIILGIGVGAATGISNGPAVGIAIGVAIGFLFTVILARKN